MRISIQEEILAALWAFDAMFAAWAGYKWLALSFGIWASLCICWSISASVKEFKAFKEKQNERRKNH